MKITERYEGIIGWFSENMPVAETELHYETPFQLLVAVVLSAQCTDKRVNIVTKQLFKKMPTTEKMASSSVEEIFEYIKSVSFPNNKASHLYFLANKLIDKHSCKVPSDRESLESLPGVGRKTANVIMSVIFNIPAMAVDTHVFRVSARIGLTHASKNVLETERQLVKHIPYELLSIAHHWLILHGRYVCVARKPKCSECGISKWCKEFEINSKCIQIK